MIRFMKTPLRAQLHTKFSEHHNAVKSMSVNTKFAKPSILGKPPSSSGRKLYSVTTFPKPVTSHSVPKTLVSKVVNNAKVIAPGMFKINPTMNSRVDNFVPNKHVKASVRTKPIIVSQPHVITKKDVDSIVCATCKQCLITATHDECVFKYVNGMNSSKKNQSANVSKRANQKKHKPNVKKLKKLGSEERLASARPSKPRTCLRWLPTERIFDLRGKITASSNTESESDIFVCDNASGSNPQEPTSKGFPNSTSFLSRFTRLRRQTTCIHPLVVL
ncbi:hypothetical protein Tco_0111495 [Tanacetum coccineum]